MIVDFTNIPDGTSVSQGNLYAGILYLEAITGNYPWSTGIVSDGTLEVQAQPMQTPPPPFVYQSHLTGVFLQPVTDVTLVVKCWRNASCSYQGVDKKGVGFNTSGLVIPGMIDGNPPPLPPGWVTVRLTIPTDGHLVSFHIGNRDDGNNANGAFWLKSISFHHTLHGHR